MSRKRGGRPIEVDADSFAKVAVSLFVERGFEEVTMDDIAAACKVSRRTLFRYYPSKSDLVWGGFREFTAPILEGVRVATPRENRVATLRDIFVAAAVLSPEAKEVTRQRLLLIDSHPRLYADGQPALLVIREAFARFLDRDTAKDASSLAAQVAASAIIAAGYTGFVWWAHHPTADLQEIIRLALREVTPGSSTTH